MSDSLITSAEVPHSSPQRILTIGGILLIITGMLFGDVFAVFILHPNADNIGKAMYLAAQAVAAQDPATVFEQFGAVGGFLENRGTKVDAHSHIIQFGFLALLLALAQPYVALTHKRKVRLAQLFLVGAVVLPPSVFLIHYVGLAYSPLQSIGWASIFADLAGLLVIIACIGELLGLWRYLRGQRDVAAAEAAVNCASPESRLLLQGGALLLLVGFLFGAYYAAAVFQQIEEREIATLNTIVEQSAAQNMQAVDQSFAAYGGLQAEKAIKIATHAHVNEVGMLALLLAFIQHLIFLDPRWRKRWAGLFLVGAIGLPLSILLELRFGLLAGGFADASGLLMIVSLFAMLFGVLRHTGKLDAAQGDST